jgi:hypothetical protein
VIAVEPDVAHARRWNQPQDPLHHAEAGAQDGHEGELLAADGPAGGRFERRVDRHRLERQIAGGLVRHEHGDLVDQLLELLGGRGAIAQQRELVTHQRVVHDAQRGEFVRRRHARS